MLRVGAIFERIQNTGHGFEELSCSYICSQAELKIKLSGTNCYLGLFSKLPFKEEINVFQHLFMEI